MSNLRPAQRMRRMAIGDYTRASHTKIAPDNVIEGLAAGCNAWDTTVLRLAEEATA